jgi:hypothetical protein
LLCIYWSFSLKSGPKATGQIGRGVLIVTVIAIKDSPNDLPDFRMKCEKHSTMTGEPLAGQDVFRSLRFGP